MRLLLAALLVLPASVGAQTTAQWRITFPANPDHATGVVDHYELVVWGNAVGQAPLPPHPLGKPVPVTNVITVNINAYVLALPPATYIGVVRAVGPGGQAVGPMSKPFTFTNPAWKPPPPVAMTMVPGEAPFRVITQHTMGWWEYDGDDTTAPIPCKRTGSVVPPAPNCFADVAEYRLLIDGAVVQTLSPSWNVADEIAFTVTTGLAAGQHSFVIQAVGHGGAVVAPEPVTLTVTPVTPDVAAPRPQGIATIVRK